MHSIKGNFYHPRVYELLTKHFIELRSVSPTGSTHVLSIDELNKKKIKFWSLWENKELLGCCALTLLNNHHGEFKSIRVSHKYRGKNKGIKIIQFLIVESLKLNIKRISLETGSGIFFKPARDLFKKCGFLHSKPFAHYKNDLNSCYLSLKLKDLKSFF